MSLSVSELSVARGGVRLVQDVSFDVSPGEALVLRGPNGVGKTTLLRALAGLQPVLSGRIEGAEDQIALAGHADGVKAALSVAENLRFWARIFGTSDITPSLEAYQLDRLADRRAGGLSAGQKRRLGLARLLLTGRAVWLLDEPTVSLDVNAVQMFASVLRTHLQAGGMAILATHIDLGLEFTQSLDLAQYRAKQTAGDAFDEAFE